MRDVGDVRKPWHRRVISHVRNHPADIVSPAVVVVLATITLLDLLTNITLGPESLSKMAVFVLCTLIIGQMTDGVRRRRATESRDAMIADLVAAQNETHRALARLTHSSQAYELTVAQREEKLSSLVLGATEWHFRGGSGRWQRSTVLPGLAKVRHVDVRYTLQIVDPRNHELCARYAAYRAVQRSVSVQTNRNGWIENVRDDLLACIYAAAWYSVRSRVEARVSLMNTYSPLRYDISSDGLVVTIADPSAPALYSNKGGWLFNALLDEVHRAHDELPTLVLPRHMDYFPQDPETVTEWHVKSALLKTSVKAPNNNRTSALLGEDDAAMFDIVAAKVFERQVHG